MYFQKDWNPIVDGDHLKNHQQMKSTMYLQKDWNLILDGDHRKNHQQDETHNAWSFPMYLQKD